MFNSNFYGIVTIISFEIKSFLREYQHTILAPLINTILFVFIISIIGNNYFNHAGENSYVNFIIPGIIIMVVMQTSFNHISEVIINMKQIGSFNDYLISPLSRIEIAIAFLIASIIIGFFITFVNITIISFFNTFEIIKITNLSLNLIMTIVIFSCLGGITGFMSYTWDTQSSISNFFIVPISFLSGTFFSIDSLGNNWKFLFEYNPFYYLVSNFRNSFFYIESFNNNSFFYIFIITTFVLFVFLYVFKKGYKVIF